MTCTWCNGLGWTHQPSKPSGRGACSACGGKPPEPPTIAPGLYRLRPGGRQWSHDELELVQIDGRWYVTPRVALAALPPGCALQADGTVRAADDRPWKTREGERE